jgi:hypothetical protein
MYTHTCVLFSSYLHIAQKLKLYKNSKHFLIITKNNNLYKTIIWN